MKNTQEAFLQLCVDITMRVVRGLLPSLDMKERLLTFELEGFEVYEVFKDIQKGNVIYSYRKYLVSEAIMLQNLLNRRFDTVSQKKLEAIKATATWNAGRKVGDHSASLDVHSMPFRQFMYRVMIVSFLKPRSEES